MESLNFLKFWRNSTIHNRVMEDSKSDVNSSEEEEQEDSFFELEISSPSCLENGKTHKKLENNEYKLESQNSQMNSKSQMKLLPIEPSPKPQSPISILKSATKFNIFLFRKPKSDITESQNVSLKQRHPQIKHVEEEDEAQVVSIFIRENSSKIFPPSHSFDSSKRFSRDVIQKYTKYIKPFNVKVSKRFDGKVRLSDLMAKESPASSLAPERSPKNIPSGFRVVCRHLGKSRSAAEKTGGASPARSRRDDSVLQRDDGIQSAILHCKRSFNSSRETSSLLCRSTSDSSQDKVAETMRKSTEENVERKGGNC